MKEEILKGLQKSLRDYDQEGCIAGAKKAIQEGVDPLRAIDALTEVIQEVGNGFSRGELFLPDLIAAGATMAGAMAELTAALKQKGLERKSLGKVVIGTVFGDIHSIGKDMVSTLMTASGFTVQDLGIDLKAEKFIEAVKQDRPDVLAMSAQPGGGSRTTPISGRAASSIAGPGRWRRPPGASACMFWLIMSLTISSD